MKKIMMLFGFLSIISLGLTSCSNDDDSGSNNTVVGLWNITRYTVDGTSVDITCDKVGQRNFQSNGTYTEQNYVLTDEQCALDSNNALRVGTYTKSGNTLRTNISGVGQFTYDIDFTSENSFTLTRELEGTPLVLTYTRVTE